MTTASTTNGVNRFADGTDLVTSDFMALASHMTACKRSRGRFFSLRATLEALHALAAPRMVTTGAVLVALSLGFVGVGLLALA